MQYKRPSGNAGRPFALGWMKKKKKKSD